MFWHKPIKFGKYKNLTPSEILMIDASYLRWAHEKSLIHLTNGQMDKVDLYQRKQQKAFNLGYAIEEFRDY